jgi:long-chain acyl-CoA synthetase
MVEKSGHSSRETLSSQVMKPEDPLLAAWRDTMHRRADDPAIFDRAGRVLLRFREIELLSETYARDDSGLGTFTRGEIVAIQIGNHPHWPALFLACLRRGIVVLPIEKTVSDAERSVALRASRVSGLITEPGKAVERIRAPDPIDWNNREPVLLKLTSGTTATPRAVRFRSAQLLADAIQICDTMEIRDADLNFAVIPISHSYGFSNLLTPLLVRGVPMAMSSDRFPRAVLGDLKRTRATVFPGMPLFFQAFGEMPDPPALPNLRLCISAGAPLNRSVSRAFREKFGRRIHSFYGASECGGICYDTEATDEGEGFVGRPLAGVELDSLDDTGGPTQVRVRSAAVGDDYFPEADFDKLGSGCFIPDDLLMIEPEGVRLVGRVSDLINVAGKKVNPAEVEAHLLAHARVRQAVVFGRSSPVRNEEVVACIVPSGALDEDELLKFCRSRLSAWQVPKRIYLLSELPANERGKVSRRQLAQIFKD